MKHKIGNFDLNKIYCMDCIEGMKKLPDNSVDLVVTSPPYNIGIDYMKYQDDKTHEEYKQLMFNSFKEIYRIIKENGIVAVVVGNQRESGVPFHFYFWLQEMGFKIIKTAIWDKGPMFIQLEFMFICSKSGKFNDCNKVKIYERRNRQLGTKWVMTFKHGESAKELGHNAFFVKELPSHFINLSTKEGDIVLDPFMGVGTTALACKELNRNFVGFELNPKYIETAMKRLKSCEQKTL